MIRRALVVAEADFQRLAERYLRFFHSLESKPERQGMESPIVWAEPSGYKSFAVPEKSVGHKFNLEEFTSVFFWGLYERIILQDEFVRKHNGVSVIGRLPLTIAYHLFYVRGQFASADMRIQPIIVNPLALAGDIGSRGTKGLPVGDDFGHTRSLAEARYRALRSLDEGGLWEDFGPDQELPPQNPQRRWLQLEEDGFSELSKEVQRQVREQSFELWVVEDVREVLQIPYHELGGVDFEGACGGASGPLWLLRSQPGGPAIQALKDPEELVRRVDEELVYRKREMPVLVVDILFERLPGQTGLEIISEVRRRAGEELVLIAHTGYGSPLVSRACHHAGADFVVQKGGRAAGSHASVTAAQARTGYEEEDRLSSWMEVFWNALALQAAYRFGYHAVSHLTGQIKKPAGTGWLGQAWRDLGVVIRPYSDVHFRKSWRENAFDLLCDAAHFVRAVREAGGLDAELKDWKKELLQEARRLRAEVSSS